MDYVFAALEAQGRTQQWLATQLGIHKSLLTHYKSGRRSAPEPIVRRACELLGLPYVFPSGTSSSPHGTRSGVAA